MRGLLARDPHDPPFQRPDVGAVDRTIIHVQDAVDPQLGEQYLVEAASDAGLGPVPQTSPGCHYRAAHDLGGHVSPGDSLAHHVDDARQCHAVRYRQPSGVPMASSRPSGKKRSYALPEVIRNQVSGHGRRVCRD